ncbi:MAG: hypothetical protein M3Z13_00105 [Candidatus Dormibacteraeota bacterium]|nr:hypothetical protein [Candidatus Dormibacteraeota bacterium]
MDLLVYPLIVLAVVGPAAFFWRRHELTEALALGAAASLAGWAAIAFARFLLLLPPSLPRLVGLIALAVSLVTATGVVALSTRHLAQPLRPPQSNRSRTLAVLLGAALLAVGIQAAVPHFGIVNLYYDWWEHFDLARFYATATGLGRHYQEGYTVTSRTPVFNLLTSLGLTAFGDRFSIFQVGTAALAWLWVLPALLLARRFLNDHVLGLVAVLSMSPLLLFATAYGWPKGLVTFFALLCLDRFFALREKASFQAAPEAVQVGLTAGLTLMTHQGFVGYLLPLFALLLWDCRRDRTRWSPLLLACATSATVALPWYAWAVTQYGLRGGLLGYPVPGYASPLLWLLDHIVVVVSSAVPITVLFNAYGDHPEQRLLVAYLRTAVGLMGAIFFLRVLVRTLHRKSAPRHDLGPLAAFALAGTVSTTLLLNGWGTGWATAEAVFIPAMLALILIALSRTPVTKTMLAVAAVESVAILAVALTYMWSSASAAEPNAILARIEHIRFLGHDTRLVGVALLLLGMAASLYGAYGFRLHKKEPRAGWREAHLVS